jgi:O-antigen/teichoic acid export membrane protein
MVSKFGTRLFEDTGYTFIGMVIVNAIGFFNSIIVARLFDDPSLLGKLFIIQNLQAVVGGLILFAIPVAITTYIPKYKIRDKNKLEKTISNGLTLLFLFSLIGASLYFLFSSIIAVELYNEPFLSLLIKINSLNVIFLTFSTLGGAILRGFQKIKELAIYGVINAAVLSPILLFFVSELDLLGAVIAYTISSFVSLIIVAVMAFKILKSEKIGIKLHLNMQDTLNIIQFSLPIFISGFVLIPARLFVATYLSIAIGFSQVGLFKIGNNLKNLFLNIPSSIGVPLLPMISELRTTNPEKIPAITVRLLKINMMITLPFIVFAGMAIKYLIILFYGATYEGAWFFSYIVLISLLFLSLSPITMNIFLGIEKQWVILYLDLLWALIYIIGSYFLIGLYGLVGIGIADVISSIFLAMVKLIYLKWKMCVEIEQLGKPFLLSFIFIIVGYYLIRTQEGFTLMLEGGILVILLLIVEYFILTSEEKEMVKDLLMKYRKYIKPGI